MDWTYSRAGVELFDDGRAPFDVTPGDLANLLIERYWREHRTINGAARPAYSPDLRVDRVYVGSTLVWG